MKRKRILTYLAAIMAILCIGVFIGILIGMPIGATKGKREAEEAYKRQEQIISTEKPEEDESPTDASKPTNGEHPTETPGGDVTPTKVPEGEEKTTGEVTTVQPTEGAGPTSKPTEEVSPTEVPKATVAPEEGTTPAPTSVPGVTDVPKATDSPEATSVPIATATLKATATPKPTAKPTVAPKATATPKPTAKPTSSVKPTNIPTAEGEKGYYGRLHVEGTYLADKDDKLVQLRGVSTHGLGWFPQYVNEAAIRQFNEEWGCNVFRLAMYTAEGAGYCTNGDDQKKKLKDLVHKGVKAAIEEDMYVIIDWHVLQDQDPNKYKDEAKKFFEEMAKTYKDDPHVIYEICNEPNGTSWSKIKKYALEVIPVIRKYAPNAIIIVGTPTWSQDVDIAANDPITEYDNVMYALHFYASTHMDSLRNKCKTAVKKGLPIFVTEYGICEASGNGAINEKQANIWIDLLDSYGISHVMWNLANKNESSSMIAAGNPKVNGFMEKDLSTSGKWFVNMLQKAGVGIGSALSGTTEAGQGDETGDSGDSSGGGNQQPAVTLEDVEKILTPGDGLVYYVSNSWNKDGGVGVQLSLSVKNDTGKDVSGWERKLTVKNGTTVEVEQFWNCSVSVKGNVITVTPADYNKNIVAGGSVGDIGIILNVTE